MTRIKVDTDLLLKKAEEIHALAEDFRKQADLLLDSVLSAGGEDADLLADARQDAYAARERIRAVRSRLDAEADSLVALARAYQSIDDQTISALIGSRGEDWFLRRFFAPIPQPVIPGFTPFYVPQTRMALADWTPVYFQGPKGLTQTDTYSAGRIVESAVGRWENPKTKKKYSVVDLGGGKFAYIPEGRLSPPIDLSRLPNREEDFTDGQRDIDPNAWARLVEGGRKPEWHAPGDPWQYRILGNMNVKGLGNAKFPDLPHANLCGELSVLFAVGETDLEAGLSRFAQLRGLGYWNIHGKKTEYTGTHVLQNIGHTTSSYDLQRLFEDYGWNVQIAGGVMPAPDGLAEKILSGKKLVFLTELDTRKKIRSGKSAEEMDNPAYGRLVPGAPAYAKGRSAHWVALTNVFQDSRGVVQVKVFNPYSGFEETYTWETFRMTCKNPGSSAGSYTYLEAINPPG